MSTLVSVDYVEQAARLAAEHNWFWGNALNPQDTRVTLADGRLNGRKSFCTGAKDSDVLLTSAIRPGEPGLIVAVVPTQREGITAEGAYVLHHFGQMWAALSGAARLVEQAAEVLQKAWESEDDLTVEARGLCAVAVSTAKVAAGQAALDVTSRVFEVMGARATAEKYRFDRFWRNVRTLTLHDPLDIKAREGRLVGDCALNGRLPTPSFYS